jgi:hypothetical protein
MTCATPLCALFLLLITWRSFSNPRHLLLLVPVALICHIGLLIGFLLPDFSETFFGLRNEWLQTLLNVYFISLGVFWLTSDFIPRVKPAVGALSAVVIMLAAGPLGLVSLGAPDGPTLYPHYPQAIAEHICFVVVVIGSALLARACCGPKCTPLKFTLTLLVWNVLYMLVLWPSIWVILMLSLYRKDAWVIPYYLPKHFVIALVDGVGLFLLQLPFLILIFCSAFHRQRFERLLRLMPVESLSPPLTPQRQSADQDAVPKTES